MRVTLRIFLLCCKSPSPISSATCSAKKGGESLGFQSEKAIEDLDVVDVRNGFCVGCQPVSSDSSESRRHSVCGVGSSIFYVLHIAITFACVWNMEQLATAPTTHKADPESVSGILAFGLLFDARSEWSRARINNSSSLPAVQPWR